MDNNAQAKVPEFLAVPSLGAIMIKAWDSEEEYLSSIIEELAPLGLTLADLEDDDEAEP